MIENNIISTMSKIEKLEIALTTFNSKRALSNIDKDLEILNVGKSSLMIDKNSPKSGYYNRVKGFCEEDIVNLENILNTYSKYEIEPCFEITPNNISENVSRTLSKEGFINVEQLVYMELKELEAIQSDSKIEIFKVTESNAEEFINIILLSNEGMDISQKVIENKKHYFYESNFHNYIAYSSGEVAGIGSMFISENVGYIANDYTFEKARGLGCQKVLLAHRINEAIKLGLESLYTDVVFGSISHSNMKKLGFTDVYMSSFWMK
ncbi:GNAT family N-acetyltransferase [Fusibacter ferrireducens]|uniref:GNAT family N-acetyltransferase n=1 Tax=Fusibacter ferrireducens TaxID=2785058 RepID=A0ABR9ZM17_9FIRM|nr:GNAT family N-acetyltransferase [Fusibacter ferrireducens]MBF4691487.1 GNAT family N-acetyltransferase [Fusibacter ferrireducens]